MKILVIYAHPDSEGHCSAILSEVKQHLDQETSDYEIIDLYKMNYDPVLKGKELYGVKSTELSDVNKELQEKVSKADKLIFIYPIWWNSMPAILKGFFDRVFTSGFAFKYGPMIPSKIRTHLLRYPFVTRFDYGVPIPLLKGKKAAVFLTTGAPKIAFFITGNRFKKLIKRDILGFFGIKSKIYQIDNCKRINEHQIEKIKRTVNKGMKRLLR
jgi:NAD(P)H dehydrogenase (quinone)